MPIRPEYRPFYRGPGWKATRARILLRANHCCEQCQKRNGAFIYTVKAPGDQLWGRSRFGPWRSCADPDKQVQLTGAQWLKRERKRVVLTIAHLNHTPGDDRDENLRCLCCYCHLKFDQEFHRGTRSDRKDAARPLLARGACS